MPHGLMLRSGHSAGRVRRCGRGRAPRAHGGTNSKGWFIGGNYGLMKNVWLTGRWLTADVAETGDPIEALSAAFLTHSVATAIRYIGDAEKGAALVDAVRAGDAEGVIFCAASFLFASIPMITLSAPTARAIAFAPKRMSAVFSSINRWSAVI